jgi:hypothetical protein
MDERQVEGREPPVGHDLDEPALAKEFGLNNRWQLADAAARQQGRQQTGEIVDRQVRLKGDGLAAAATLVNASASRRQNASSGWSSKSLGASGGRQFCK